MSPARWNAFMAAMLGCFLVMVAIMASVGASVLRTSSLAWTAPNGRVLEQEPRVGETWRLTKSGWVRVEPQISDAVKALNLPWHCEDCSRGIMHEWGASGVGSIISLSGGAGDK